MKFSLNKLIRIVVKTVLSIILLVLFVYSLFYINTTIYNFPKPKIFQGEFIHNPYQNLPDSVYRANFHAHSVAWKEVTDGYNTEKDLFEAYTERGYHVAGISNYHKISEYGKDKTDLYIPVYEHGYNVLKSHYLSINSDGVSYFDYPLFQLTSHQQKIIENLREQNAIVSMAHPKFGGGRSFSDMEYLVNYEFTEVLNHYRVSDEYWDKALSAGRLTWIMGNDDTHDIINEPTFMIWNMIYSEERSVEGILSGMKAGKNYGVKSLNGDFDNEFISCEVIDENVRIVLSEPAVQIEFIGQGGEIKKVIENDSIGTYTFDANDTYIRAVARNVNSSIYLNPLVRYDGKSVPLNTKNKVTSNFIKTWMFRIGMILISFSILILIRKIIRRK